MSEHGWYNDETGDWDKEEPDLPSYMKPEEDHE